MKTISALLQQQQALADFGSFAFREHNLQLILERAARVCAECIGVPFCKVCHYRSSSDDLLVVAGHGWSAGVVGEVVSKADRSSPQGEAFITGSPKLCPNILDGRFDLPAFYLEYGIISTVDVPVKGVDGPPYGIIEMDSPVEDFFSEEDIQFLTGFANILAEAVVTAERTSHLTAVVNQLQTLVMEKDVLAQELEHRVRNGLHLVHAMLTNALDEPDDASRLANVASVALRVLSMAKVYDHLFTKELTRAINLGEYLLTLCNALQDLRRDRPKIAFQNSGNSIALDIDAVTTIGIVIVELISNVYDHAFPFDDGTIALTLKLDGSQHVVLTIRDDGVGFDPGVETKRRGLGLVRRLMKQINGSIRLSFEGGTTWTLNFARVV